MTDGPIRRDAAGSTGSDEPGTREVVTGWGRNPSSVSQVTRPPTPTSWPWP